jgi:hypothetical protein
MDGAKKTFLLPCACSAMIEVVAGQAGGEVACGSCGRSARVPKLRELSALAVKPASAPATRPWSTVQAVTLAGTLLAVLAWGAAAFIGAVPTAAYSPTDIRLQVDAADDLRLYQALLDFAEASPNRMPMRDEVMLRRKAEFATGIARALYAVGGLGALAAAAAWLGGLSGSRPS